MAKSAYEKASRQQRRLAQQYLKAHPELKTTDITTLSAREYELIEAMHLEANNTDHILGPTERQLEIAEQYLKSNPALNTSFEELSDKEVGAIEAMYNSSNRSQQTPELSAQEQEIANVKRNLKQVETRKVDPMVQIREEARKRKLQSEPLAQDTVIFGDSNAASIQPRSRPNISVNANDAIDPITQAIRDQIITSQHLFLQQEIGKTMENPEKEEFLNKDLVAIRAFLQTDEGKLAVKDVMKNPQAQMHKIETTGYKFVHNKFNDRFRDVDWGARSENKIRSTDVTNDAGEAVCTLRETTFDTKPTVVTLEDGTTRTIKSYRQIDFPKELETGNGPLHLLMAVKDENGKNIAEKDAVYFTAHYDDNGKLTEVSSPTPVKFSGRGDDAVGYIERNGKVYTLPVTQGKYREMMMEVAKNKGTNVDISQELEASDRIIQPKAKLRPVNRQVEEQE